MSALRLSWESVSQLISRWWRRSRRRSTCASSSSTRSWRCQGRGLGMSRRKGSKGSVRVWSSRFVTVSFITVTLVGEATGVCGETATKGQYKTIWSWASFCAWEWRSWSLRGYQVYTFHDSLWCQSSWGYHHDEDIHGIDGRRVPHFIACEFHHSRAIERVVFEKCKTPWVSSPGTSPNWGAAIHAELHNEKGLLSDDAAVKILQVCLKRLIKVFIEPNVSYGS